MHLFSQLSKLGTSVVISTHNDELVARHPHPVLHMSRGRLASPLPGPASLAAAG
jgi:ABC-type ATPase involved in cell division